MAPYDDMRKRTMRLRVFWQKTVLKFRRLTISAARWMRNNVPWVKLAYFTAGMLVIIAFWGLAFRRDTIFHRLQIPIHNEGLNAPGAEVEALSRLQKEVATLKARLKQISDPDRKAVSDFNPAKFARPALGVIGQAMGWTRVGDEWQFHDGIDIAVPPGTNVVSAADGVVKFITDEPAMGTIVGIDHGNGWESRYAHLQGILVSPGQKVEKGAVLGQASAHNCLETPGFHFSIYLNGKPVDPAGVIAGLGD